MTLLKVEVTRNNSIGVNRIQKKKKSQISNVILILKRKLVKNKMI